MAQQKHARAWCAQQTRAINRARGEDRRGVDRRATEMGSSARPPFAATVAMIVLGLRGSSVISLTVVPPPRAFVMARSTK